MLAQQIGSKGYFGKIRLAVEPVNSMTITVAFDETYCQDWRIGTEFGIVYGWELYRRSQPVMKGLRVQVVEICGKPADTTNLVVAFVAAHALWDALEWAPPKAPVFDPKGGCFTFSKY